jgi:hypothetical protein
MDRGALGLLVNEGKPKLVHLPEAPASDSVSKKTLEARVAPDGAAQIDWRVDVSGAQAGSWRTRYHAKATQKQRVQEDLGSEIPGVDIAQVTANDLDDVEQKVEIRAKGKATAFARKDGDAWTVPVGAKEHLVRTWAPLSSRKRDIRIFALTTQENQTIVHVPAGARITTSPRSANGKSAFGSYAVEAEVNGNTVRVKTTVAITKSRIAATEYPAFRAFCEEADRALGQTLSYTVAK